MSAAQGPDANRREQARVPFDGAVRLRYRLFQEFLKESAANISRGGMFIRTNHPGKPAHELDFEIRLEDDFALIAGRGQVAWVRREPEGPDAPAGMGIRFLELDRESRALVDRIVADRVAEGLELFDLAGPESAARRPEVSLPPDEGSGEIWELERAAAAADAEQPEEGPDEVAAPPEQSPSAVESLPEPENLVVLDPELPAPGAPPAPAVAPAGPPAAGAAGRASPFRLLSVAVISALLGASAVLLFQRFYVEPSVERLEPSIDELEGGPGGPWRPPADEPQRPAAEAADAGRAAPVTAGSVLSSEVVDALRQWARAWSEQRVEGYLAAYAARFEPPDGLDRAAWEAARRARIERPEWIRVALTHVEVQEVGPDAAEARFIQSYRSERYTDLVRKRLVMVRENGVWKIASERTAAQ